MHAFLHQPQPLQHAEAVLLVDDRQAQPLELHVLFEQRVRPHHHLHQPLRHQLLQLRFLARAGRPGQQQRHVSDLGQNLLEVEVVLRRQDLGGREHGGLVAVFHRDHGRLGRHDGLAAAHVALQQAIHGTRLLHIVGDLLEHALLRPGGLERQHGLDLLAHPAGAARKRCPAVCAPCRACSATPHSSQKNSSKIRRNCAGERKAFSSRRSLSGGGKCVWRMAVERSGSFRRAMSCGGS